MLETNSLTSPSLTCTISPDPQEPHVLVIKANQILAVLLHICCHHGQKSTAAIKLVAAVLSSIKKKIPDKPNALTVFPGSLLSSTFLASRRLSRETGKRKTSAGRPHLLLRSCLPDL